jgi:UDP-N-acetylglucosamine diphosphorylase / glucose-1-phosphate thymidylyltransferase / UDP-N-acetylgalactosamine diphosphorylase / glucosamine-1-phosphate N-acetyltransferase / galactosamine-1-phosphate N-acetyltransferase
MQCVILAAGKGTRLKPLTDNCPKPLVKVAGKPLLEHIIEALPTAIDEVIIVVGYLGSMIKDYFGDEFQGKKIRYIEQTTQDGTGRALWLCKDMLKGRFLFMFADDIHGKTDIARVASYTRGLLTMTSDNPERFGVIVRNPDGTLAEIIEKPSHPPSNLVSTGVMVLDDHIFEFEPITPIGGEYYLTEALEKYARVYPVAIVEETLWLPIGYPEDIERAEKVLAQREQA